MWKSIYLPSLKTGSARPGPDFRLWAGPGRLLGLAMHIWLFVSLSSRVINSAPALTYILYSALTIRRPQNAAIEANQNVNLY